MLRQTANQLRHAALTRANDLLRCNSEFNNYHLAIAQHSGLDDRQIIRQLTKHFLNAARREANFFAQL